LAEDEKISAETEELIRCCQRGDEWALGTLVRRYQNYVFRLCYLVMRNEQDAEDMAQETFVRAFRALPRFEIRVGKSFEAWLYRIAVNTCRSRLRRRWHQASLWPEPAVDTPGEAEHQPDYRLIESEQRDEILAAVNTLNEKHRLVVILRYYAGLTNEEIAETLRIPSGTVRSRLHTARQQLKSLLGYTGAEERPATGSRRWAR